MKVKLPCLKFAVAAIVAMTAVPVHAAEITVVNDFTTLRSIATNANLGVKVNSGGLKHPAFSKVWADGDDGLNVLVTIDDSADTGAIFEAILQFTGERYGDTYLTAPALTGVRMTGGQIGFKAADAGDKTNENNQSKLTVQVISITQVSGPAATATFDGFSAVNLFNFRQPLDRFTVDGQACDGKNSPTEDFAELTFNSLVANGATFEGVLHNDPVNHAGADWRMTGLSSQFTVVAAAE